MIVLLYGLAILGWMGASLALRDGAPPAVFPGVIAIHALTVASLLVRAPGELAGIRRGLVVAGLLALLLPPLAPPVSSYLLAGAFRRATRATAPEAPGRDDLAAATRVWWASAPFGIALGVLWGWAFLERLEETVRAAGIHPWMDPFARHGLRLGSFAEIAFVAAAAAHFLQLRRSSRLLAALRALGAPDAQPPAP